ADGDAVGIAADEEIDLLAFGELELAGGVGLAAADVDDGEAQALDGVVDELSVADHRGGCRRGRGRRGGCVPAAARTTSTTAGSDECGRRHLQQQIPDNARLARALVIRPCVHGCSNILMWLCRMLSGGDVMSGFSSPGKEKGPCGPFSGNQVIGSGYRVSAS